jgi:uncharacterized protein YkwD
MKNLLVILFPFLSYTQIDNVAIQAEFGKLLNQYRVSQGQTQVTFNSDAKAAAKIQADYLASTCKINATTRQMTGIVGHTNPDPNLENAQKRVISVNSKYDSLFRNYILSATENAAGISGGEYNTQQIAVKLFEIWKKSVGHNLALLDEDNLEFGIYVSCVAHKVPYTDYEVDMATMSNKPVTKYFTDYIYTSSLVFITKVTMY